MHTYPQWFIGGPLDGKNKTDEFPTVPDWSYVKAMEYTDGPDLPAWAPNNSIEWIYRMDKLTLGTVTVPFWTDRRLLPHALIATRLGELIMAPHAKETEDAKNDRES